MPALAPGPYEVPAPDGRTYFKYLPEVRGLVNVWVQGLEVVTELRAVAHPAARPKAQLLSHALTQLEQKVLLGEVTVAQATDVAVRERIRATQKRPDNPRGPQMVNAIESRPVRPGGSPLPLFAVGQVDIGILDAGTTSKSGAPYWRTQEFGYTGFLGRQVFGAFQPGGAAPDPGQFRVHPIFQTGSPFHKMTIQRPIEARAFLRSGVMAGALLRARMWRSMESQALGEIRRALTLGVRGPRRRR